MEKEKINITAIQMESIIADKQANFDKITKLFKENIKPNTDIVVLPELWNVGWACDKFIEASEEIKTSETVGLLSELAQKYNVNIHRTDEEGTIIMKIKGDTISFESEKTDTNG